MKPKPKSEQRQFELFQAQFEQLLNLDHPLCVLANKIDWQQFEASLAGCYCPDFGAPAKATRLLVALHYLKHTFNESDESLIERWVENPYRGHNYKGPATIHISGSSTRTLTRTQKRRRKRRSAVEPKIGHLKSDNRMRRCFLKGLSGDAINAVLAAAGSNLQKLLRAIAHALIFCLWSRLAAEDSRPFAHNHLAIGL